MTIREVRPSRDCFDAKASRYALAMATCPYARIRELVPMAEHLPYSGGRLLDLFGGTGFVSDIFADRFDGATLLDETTALVPGGTVSRDVVCGSGVDWNIIKGFAGRYSAVVCLAGMHHVLPQSEVPFDDNVTRQLRGEVVNLWMEPLSVGGRLLIADVPCSGDHQAHRERFAWRSDGIGRLDEVLRHFPEEDDWSWVLDADPAAFLNGFVAEHCPQGHVGHFDSPQTLSSHLEFARAADIRTFVAPTPWFFRDRLEAAWFFHEMFGLGGASSRTPEDLSDEARSTVLDGIHEHLGMRDMGSDGCLVGWRLLYAVGTRQ